MRTLYRHPILRRLVAAVMLLDVAGSAMANPTGMTVQKGSAATTVNGSQLTITASQLAVLNWQSFNIAAGETTIFNQPSISSVVLNRINDQNPSQIYGSLQANGLVVLMNASGFYFGPDSFVKTGGLIVSTANCLPPQNSGGSWEFNGPPPLASIVNYGQIKIGNGGSAFLIADKIENHGNIEAPGGTVGLAAGQTVLLSERPDGRGMSMQVTLPSGSVDNEGRLIADGGTIAMNARVVNQNGFIQANSVQNVNGTIELVASDQLTLGASSQIIAGGDNSPAGSAGGNVTLQSGNNFSDSVGSQITVTGGTQGGNGGDVEISAPNVLSLNSSINARAQTGWTARPRTRAQRRAAAIINARAHSGWTAGKLLLDPDYIILDTSGSGSAGSGIVLAGDNSGSTLDLNVNSAFANLAVSQIILQAAYDITLASGTSWNLSGTIGADLGGVTSGLLTLEAGRNIIFGGGSSISDANNWSVALKAGVSDFTAGTVQSGKGSIYLNGGNGLTGSGSIQMASGYINNGIQLPAISLIAGQDIQVGSGYVITTGGGSIYAHALAGSIDTGSDSQGYFFKKNASSLSTAYDLSDGLGGISTAAGGDVTLIAGGDVTSVLPGNGVYYYDGNQESPNNADYLTAGSGAYGSQPGNVTIVAGGDVKGHYLVANGTGSIFAGGSAGADLSNNGLALSLINGGWNVTAAQNILLQEVRNPNGDFDYNGGTAYNHYFNYAPGDYVNLSAGNLVQLGASIKLPRLSSKTDTKLYNVPVIYPSILNITAGDGGVKLGPGSPSLTLFPSPQGSLTIDTTGPLVNGLNGVTGAPQLFNLIVSDSGSSQYTSGTSFGVGETHAASPVHLDASTPIYLKIDGDMDYINLIVPEAAQINVGGNMNNCGFQGMNLSSAPSYQVQILEADGSTRTVTVNPAVTSINVSGDIFNGSSFTSVDLSRFVGAQGLDLSDLGLAVNNKIGGTFISGTDLATSFYYNSTTDILTYQNIAGFKLADVLQLLQNLTVQKTDAKGNLLWKDSLDTIPDTKQVSVLSAAEAQALLAQYNTLSAAPYALAYNASSYGYTIGGGGTFDIMARTMDLGTSAGIQSEGVALYNVRGSYPLARLFGNGGVFNHGADITITTTGNHSGGITAADEPFGDLDMFSSSIASLQGGNISIVAGGDVNAGSAVLSVNSAAVRGIYSTSQGDVSVIADGDININGSRIMTYDGGNITVESLNGSVNAGTGASTPVSITDFYEDPVTHAVYSDSPQIPFSGIAALTFPKRDSSYPAPVANLGNILVEAPYGDINATVAGILQIPLNHLNYPDAITTVLAGYGMNNSGNPVYALGDKNVVTVALGSTFGVSYLGVPVLDKAGHPIILTQLLDASGAPVLDAAGQQLYVEETYKKPVGFGGSVETYSLDGSKPSVNPYHDANGDPVAVVALPNTSDSLGNEILVYGRNINVNGSGIIASNAKLLATGDINGLIFARNNLDLDAQHTVDVTALALGTATVSGQQVEGTIVGVGGVNVTGDSITAALISDHVTGDTSGQSGLGQGTAANATAQAVASDDSTKTAVAANQIDDSDEKKKKGQGAPLMQKTGRVTILLPPKHLSQNQTSSSHL
jgi:filamentous hemagglutinin family protein